jgi:hypothetical protein
VSQTTTKSLRLSGPSFDKVLEIVTPTVTLIQCLSITLGYLATGNAFENLKFINGASLQYIRDMFTARQTDGN